MDTYRSVFSKVLNKIKPTDYQENKNKKILEEIVCILRKKISADVDVEPVGSFVKGTHIKNKKEFDVFLLFPKKYSKQEISKLGIGFGKKSFNKTVLAYAEHPYLRAKYKGYDIDLVPAYKLASPNEKATAVDRSPFHATYINKKLNEKQKDDVRLLKQFLKAQNIYGAELRVEGFSGYLAELLIVKYGDILTLFKKAAEWKIPVSIDIEKYGTTSQFSGPMIVIDPVDSNRNVSAVVSTTSLSRFIFYSREFIKKPEIKYFLQPKKKINKKKLVETIKKRNTCVDVYEFDAPDVIEDILWPQLRKIVYGFKYNLEKMEFNLLGFYYWSDRKKCIIMFETYTNTLPSVNKLIGPDITRISDVEKFRQKHKKAVDMQIAHNKIVAIESRKYDDFDKVLKHLIYSNVSTTPTRFLKPLKKKTKLTIENFVEKYPEIASDYFMRTIK
ncbi:CCA tRNA nucleotidyltransferase [Candidatus Micrarchaeota archaeon]|nr:CCA tRNA nucleotidyltransferase [Candidatus Micrarchaeota archaeon]